MDLGRFKRLKAEGIASNHTWLNNAIEKYGFPQPKALGPNLHAWDMDEVYAWVKSRPQGKRDAALTSTPPQRTLKASKKASPMLETCDSP